MFCKEKYKALPQASQELMRKATFLDPRYRGEYDSNVNELKRMIEEEAVILGRAAQPVRAENEEEEGAATEPQPKKITSSPNTPQKRRRILLAGGI